jgi:hypothetical protein
MSWFVTSPIFIFIGRRACVHVLQRNWDCFIVSTNLVRDVISYIVGQIGDGMLQPDPELIPVLHYTVLRCYAIVWSTSI